YRTSALAGGDYHLLVWGKGVAAQAVPFTIRAGEEVVVDLQPQAGVSQRFVCEPPAGAKAGGVVLRLMRGGVYMGTAWTSGSADGLPTGETWLLPGDYAVNAEAGDLRGSATFTVGAVAGEPVRIALR